MQVISTNTMRAKRQELETKTEDRVQRERHRGAWLASCGISDLLLSSSVLNFSYYCTLILTGYIYLMRLLSIHPFLWFFPPGKKRKNETFSPFISYLLFK